MSENPEQIRAEIQERFARIAQSPNGEDVFRVGLESAKRLGYASTALDALPSSVTESFAGVGNPLALGNLQPGQVILDMGCGAGLDSILAAKQVGPHGKVIGVDFSPAMVDKAKHNAALCGVTIEVHGGELEHLPVADQSVDRILSNGAFNLCWDKPRILSEAFRVLRPGGRIQMADIFLHDSVTEDELTHKGTWSD